MQRRRFLGGLAAGALAARGPWPVLDLAGAPEDAERALVLVELDGGNDALGTLVPREDDAYFRARPKLALAKDATIRVDDALGLHPALAALAPHAAEGRLAAFCGVGFPESDRSHFRAMDVWHSGVPDREETRSGWIGRAVRRAERGEGGTPPEALFALAPGRAPLVLAGAARSVTAIRSLGDLELRGGEEQAKAVARGLRRSRGKDSPRLEEVRRRAEHALAFGRRLDAAAKAAPAETRRYPDSPFAAQLALAGSLIAGGFRRSVHHVRLGGFDTHVRQDETHPATLRVLAEGLDAFLAHLGRQKREKDVLVLVFSEFGRRVAENGGRGTDHGSAGLALLLGEGLRPGRHGASYDLETLERGDLRALLDWRDLQDRLLSEWMGWAPERPLRDGLALLAK
ncbi:MAG: DUF1501 domain-containing protein [Planctomycetota bacterium]